MASSVLAEGLYFGEGPRWHDGRLWFSDFYDRAVKAVDAAGTVETMVETPGQSSGLGWLPDGRLLLVSMLDRRLLRLDPGGLVEHADLSSIATFHANDMVVDASGRAYVGNFGFDLDAFMAEHGIAGLLADPGPPTAALARVEPDGTVHVAADGMKFPNGSVITPDDATLIVAETIAMRLTAFDIAADGSLSNRRVWADIPGLAPDGICLDAEGAVWVANALGAECARVHEGGEVSERVEVSQPCYACMLGGDDGTTLFALTAATSVAAEAARARTGRVETARVAVPHAGRP